MNDYILGYLNGYQDGTEGHRSPDQPHRSSYNAGYDHGHEDGIYNEDPDYSRADLDELNRVTGERLSFFAV